MQNDNERETEREKKRKPKNPSLPASFCIKEAYSPHQRALNMTCYLRGRERSYRAPTTKLPKAPFSKENGRK